MRQQRSLLAFFATVAIATCWSSVSGQERRGWYGGTAVRTTLPVSDSISAPDIHSIPSELLTACPALAAAEWSHRERDPWVDCESLRTPRPWLVATRVEARSVSNVLLGTRIPGSSRVSYAARIDHEWGAPAEVWDVSLGPVVAGNVQSPSFAFEIVETERPADAEVGSTRTRSLLVCTRQPTLRCPLLVPFETGRSRATVRLVAEPPSVAVRLVSGSWSELWAFRAPGGFGPDGSFAGRRPALGDADRAHVFVVQATP